MGFFISHFFCIFVGMEKKTIYKFLDMVTGEGIICFKIGEIRGSSVYQIKSNNGYIILTFFVSKDGKRVRFYESNYSEELYNILNSFFPLERKICLNYIRDWFGDKHDLKKVNDVKKFIPRININ